jgi:hypothetical protein
LQQCPWIPLLPSLFLLSKNNLSPQFPWAMVIKEATCWHHCLWCGVKNATGISVYSLKVHLYKIVLYLALLITILIYYTGLLKSHTTHSWHMSYLSKNKLHWNQKTKNNVMPILIVGNVHCTQQCMRSLFSSCLMQTGEEFLCHRNGSPGETVFICMAQQNQEMYS